jgi:hypothetical protein
MNIWTLSIKLSTEPTFVIFLENKVPISKTIDTLSKSENHESCDDTQLMNTILFCKDLIE